MKRRVLWSLAIALILLLALTVSVSAQNSDSEGGHGDVFVFKGFSIGPLGTNICAGFDVNYEAKEAYEAELGRSVDIGIVFASYDNLNGQTPLDESGNPRTPSKMI